MLNHETVSFVLSAIVETAMTHHYVIVLRFTSKNSSQTNPPERILSKTTNWTNLRDKMLEQDWHVITDINGDVRHYSV